MKKNPIYRNSLRLIVLTLACIVFLVFSPRIVSVLLALISPPTIACDSLDSTDLATHAANQIDNRIATVSASGGLAEYTSRPLSQTLPWPRNPNAWTSALTPLDFTGVAGWTDAGWPLIGWGDQVFYTHGETLISPRHYLTAAHLPDVNGSKIGFLDPNGNQVIRTVVNNYTIPNTDINIGVLDSDVPNTITHYPIMNSATLKNLIQKTDPNPNLDVPIVDFNQDSFALVHSMYSLVDRWISHHPYASGPRSSFSKPNIRSGDSGSPAFIIIDNQPVLLLTETSGGSGPNLGSYISELNAAMTAMGHNENGYQVTEYNPTCFTQYLNVAPQFTGGSGTIVINQAKIQPNVAIDTVTAYDTDAGQTIAFSLDSLSGNHFQGTINPLDYLRIDSATGQIFQTHPIDTNTYGTTLSLAVKATDNGAIPASRILNIPLKLYSFDADPNFSFDPAYSQSEFSDYIEQLAFDHSNNLIVAGFFDASGSLSANTIARFTNTGKLDTTFHSGLGPDMSVESMFVEPDGKIVMTYYDPTLSDPPGVLVRLNPDGSLDTDFMNHAALANMTDYEAKAFPFGDKIIVTMAHDPNGASGATLMLLNSDGATNASYLYTPDSGNTISSWQRSANEGDQILWSINLSSPERDLPRGKIIRLNSDFTMDQTFNSAVGTGANGPIYDMKVLSNNKILVVGYFTSFNSVSAPSIVLLNSDGTVDTAFENNIEIRPNSTLYPVIIQPDDKILLAGSFTSFNGHTTGNLVRINADGTLDPVFYDNMGGGLEAFYGPIAQRSDGAIALFSPIPTRIGNQLFSGMAVLVTKKQTDTLPPELSEGSGSRILHSGDMTEHNDIDLSGTALADANVQIFDGDSAIASATADASGLWSAQIHLNDGTHSIAVSQSLNFLTTETSNRSPATMIVVGPIQSSSSSISSAPRRSGGGGGGGGGGVGKTAGTNVTTLGVSGQQGVKGVTQNLAGSSSSSPPRTLHTGMAGSDVSALQNILLKQKILTGPVTGTYDANTVKAVFKFQQTVGIKPTGIADVSTQQKLQALSSTAATPKVTPSSTPSIKSFTRTLTVGMQGTDVSALQTYLSQQKFLSGTFKKGTFDQATKTALIAFQKKNKLRPSGMVDSATKLVLNKIQSTSKESSASSASSK